MAHTYVFEDEGLEVRFHYNPDRSGDCIITKEIGGLEITELTVPTLALVAFVAELVRLEKINQLEQATILEVLGLPPIENG